MILDSTHRRWFVGTTLAAVALLAMFVYLNARTPLGVTGNTTEGLWYGVVGTLVMLFVGGLCIHRHLPVRWWIGPRRVWLKAHIWLGLLSIILIACHSGFRLGGLLGIALWIVLSLITVSGVFGLILQQWLPGYITRLPVEAAFEQLPHYCDVLRERSDEYFGCIGMAASDDEYGLHTDRVRSFYDNRIRPGFVVPLPRRSAFRSEGQVRAEFARLRLLLRLPPSDNPIGESERLLVQLRERLNADAKEPLGKLEKARTTLPKILDSGMADGLQQMVKNCFAELRAGAVAAGDTDGAVAIFRVCASSWLLRMEELAQERAGYFAQEKAHRWLHGWQLLHIPLSAALLILVIAHIVMSLYY